MVSQSYFEGLRMKTGGIKNIDISLYFSMNFNFVRKRDRKPFTRVVLIRLFRLEEGIPVVVVVDTEGNVLRDPVFVGMFELVVVIAKFLVPTDRWVNIVGLKQKLKEFSKIRRSHTSMTAMTHKDQWWNHLFMASPILKQDGGPYYGQTYFGYKTFSHFLTWTPKKIFMDNFCMDGLCPPPPSSRPNENFSWTTWTCEVICCFESVKFPIPIFP